MVVVERNGHFFSAWLVLCDSAGKKPRPSR
jgi:hypothetical protein